MIQCSTANLPIYLQGDLSNQQDVSVLRKNLRIQMRAQERKLQERTVECDALQRQLDELRAARNMSECNTSGLVGMCQITMAGESYHIIVWTTTAQFIDTLMALKYPISSIFVRLFKLQARSLLTGCARCSSASWRRTGERCQTSPALWHSCRRTAAPRCS